MGEKSKKELARLARAEYQKQWKKNNPEAVKRHTLTYWAKRGAKLQQEAQDGSDKEVKQDE